MILEINLAEANTILTALDESEKKSLKIMNNFQLGSIVHQAHMAKLKHIDRVRNQIRLDVARQINNSRKEA